MWPGVSQGPEWETNVHLKLPPLPALLLSASPLFLLSSSSPPIFSREGEHLRICVGCFFPAQILEYARPGADLSVVLGISTDDWCGLTAPAMVRETNMRLNLCFVPLRSLYQ